MIKLKTKAIKKPKAGKKLRAATAIKKPSITYVKRIREGV